MPTNKAKIGTYVPQEVYQTLKTIAEKEKRSVSSLVYKIIVDFIETWASKSTPNKTVIEDLQTVDDENSASLLHQLTTRQSPTDTQLTIPSLVKNNMTKLKKTGVQNLEAIVQGTQLPSASDFSIIAAELGLTPDQQQQIWIKTFKHTDHQQEGTTNGSY